MWLENVLLPWLAGRVFVCECVFKRGWLGGGGVESCCCQGNGLSYVTSFGAV